MKNRPMLLAAVLSGMFAASGSAMADGPGRGDDRRPGAQRMDDRPRDAGRHAPRYESRYEPRYEPRHAARYEERHDMHRDARYLPRPPIYFSADSRRIARDYYGRHAYVSLPPGYARHWAMGRPLPRGVRYYAVPHDLAVRLPPPPPHYHYVRVARDILLIAVGTGLVIDAMENILH